MSSEVNRQSLQTSEEPSVDNAKEGVDAKIAVSIMNLSKVYHIYDRPEDRLKQSLYPRLNRLIGRLPRSYYHEFWALKDICFDVRKGETVGIVGRNGSGKSTLLQLICGTLQPSAGAVQTNGRVAALLELGSGFNPEFTGRENVYMNAAILGLSRGEVDQRYDEIAAFADIGQFIDQPVKTYSSGMMVRLAFSVAINVEPEILIIDEALSVGDELFQRKCFSRIEAIRSGGATILFVSHSGGTVLELCDRAVLLDAGEKLAQGTPKDIVGHYYKLLFAPPEKYEAIRENIREISGEATSVPIDEDRASSTNNNTSSGERIRETYDPNLTPSSTIVYESRGAIIHSPKIMTLSGDHVNHLLRGEPYIFSYIVNFTHSASNVRFAMLIKTTTGVELGGGVSAGPASEGTDYIANGESYRIEFNFTSNLSPGMYFMNAGVGGHERQSEIILHRIVDILAFKVLPDTSYLGTGTVDFGCLASIKRV